jgi:lipopolysaccharide transport system ATP-binding protein
MSEKPVIEFQGVSKRFAFSKETPQSILEMLISIFSRPRKRERHEPLWAVRDVDFAVLPGQSFGIVGRNGSGKSTILKMISRILRPTTGRVVVYGRVSALLELGAGFHQDLTGRENVFLNASLMGLSEEETVARFDDILEFSELGEFIDMPVKYYSSGMYMRLGFSVAINMDPDILVIDEILAVGDQPFQTKCLDAIMSLKRRGVTIVFVSHNIQVMRSLCTHLLWVDKGQVRALGDVDTVSNQYIAYSAEIEGGQMAVSSYDRRGSGDIEITNVQFLNAEELPQQQFLPGDPMTIEIAYNSHFPAKNPEFGIAIFRHDGTHIYGPNTRADGVDLGIIEGRGKVRYEIASLPLAPGRYTVSAAIHQGDSPLCYDFHEEAYVFKILTGERAVSAGIVVLPASWEQHALDSQPVLEPPH